MAIYGILLSRHWQCLWARMIDGQAGIFGGTEHSTSSLGVKSDGKLTAMFLAKDCDH